jgi:hypothetical protein
MVGSEEDIVNASFLGLKDFTSPPSSVTFFKGDAQQVF